jgi:hypothetical protein
MNTYYLRTIDYPQLLDFGTRLGVIQFIVDYEVVQPVYESVLIDSDDDGFDEYKRVAVIGEDGEQVYETVIKQRTQREYVEGGTPIATDCGYLDYIGEITRDEEVITNPDGIPYIHANLITPHDLRALAIASTDPEIQAALADIAAWFVVDSEGNAVAPNQPHRIFG